MKNLKTILMISVLGSALAGPSWASLSVLTTTSDLGDLVRQVGGDLVQVDSICKGTQDPHFIEAKPSFMLKASRADLIVAVGLELEIGYLPSIIQGARNPKVNPGAPGYLELGPRIQPIEVQKSQTSRAEGDVHPDGNPHFTLDPIRDGEAAVVIGERLAELDPSHAVQYKAHAENFKKKMEERTRQWALRVEKTGIKKIVTYHKTLNYFFDRFHIQNPIELEPKPGIPPTSGHTIQVIQMIREQHIPLILVENFFDPSVTRKIKQEVPAVRDVTVPVAVDGAPGIRSIEDLIEKLVQILEGK